VPKTAGFWRTKATPANKAPSVGFSSLAAGRSSLIAPFNSAAANENAAIIA
jgi:hypothetical protein